MSFSHYSFYYKQVDEFSKAKQKLLCPAYTEKKIVKKQFYLDISSKFHYSKNGKLHIDLTWNVEVGRLI